MTCKRGEIVLVLFPNSDLVTFKKRPALVVQADALPTGLQTDSVIATDNLATVRDSEITRVLGVWPETVSLDAALRHTFGLSG